MRPTHVVPTHLRTPETMLTLAGITLSVRQFLLLLLGAAMSYDLWLHLAMLGRWPAGLVLRLCVAVMPFGLAGAVAFVRLAGRALEIWVLVLLRYHRRPRLLVWRSVRWQEPLA